MQTIKLKNVVPLIRLQLTKNTGEVIRVTSRRKMKIISKIVRDPASELKLEVVYGPDILNAGTYTDKDMALRALSDWTSKEQLDFICGGEWEVPDK